MTTFDWVLVAFAFIVGGLFTWEVHRVIKRPQADREFSRRLATGGVLDHDTGLRTGVDATGESAMAIIQRERAVEVTGEHPIAARVVSSSE